MSTDAEWERWGAMDPYYGVLTSPKFRMAALTAESREEFFASGHAHASYVLATCRARFDPAFAPRNVLDFGCGVGRLLIAFAQSIPLVTGVDVSPSMLAEARRNCDSHGLADVVLLPSDDQLTAVTGDFDLVHSCIVLQHVEVERGRHLFERLVQRVHSGGIGALHVTFAWDMHDATYGQPPPVGIAVEPDAPGTVRQLRSQLRRILGPLGPRPQVPLVEAAVANVDPEMQMNFYNLSELLFILHRCGVKQLHTDITDHGGALGVFLFFRRS